MNRLYRFHLYMKIDKKLNKIAKVNYEITTIISEIIIYNESAHFDL